MVRRSLALMVVGVCVAACSQHSPTAPSASATSAPHGDAAAIRLTLTPATLPPGGGTVQIRIETLANEAGTVAAPHVPLSLSASTGELAPSSVETDSSGHATASWTGTSAATIRVWCADGDAVGTGEIHGPAATTPPPNPAPSPSPAPTPPPKTPVPAPPFLSVDISATPRLVEVNVPVAFSASTRSSDGAPVGVLTYAWDFEADGIVDSTAAAPTHAFTRAADHYSVVLTVTAADGRLGRGAIDVVVGGPPVRIVTIESISILHAPLGSPFTFEATTSSNAAAGPVTSITWDFGDGSHGTGATTTHAYATPGERTVWVTARTDNGSIGTKFITITVE